MKILVINTVEFGINGMSKIIIDFYRFMDKKGKKIDFAANDRIEKAYADIIREGGSRIFEFRDRNKKPFAYIKKLSDLIREEDYDVVHIHGNSSLMLIELEAVRKSGCACKTIVHGHNTSCTHKMLHNILHKRFMKSFDYAAACSREAGRFLCRNDDFFLLNNGIEESKFLFDENIRREVRRKNKNDDKFVLLHVGLFNEQKNHEFLLDVFAAVLKKDPNCQLRLLGEGELMPKIREKAEQMGIADKVIFAGVTLDPEKEYNGADILVFPSLYESFGLVAVEAQCCGLPCVVSDRVPASVGLSDEFERMPLEDSPEKWAKHILFYKGKKSRRSRDKETAEKGFSIKENADRLRRFYEKMR